MEPILAKKKNIGEVGQSILIIAVALVALISFIGLTVDMGLLFIAYGHLRRGVDAAAIGAAAQLRENYTAAQLNASATEYLRLNGVDVDNASAQVFQCDPGQPDNDPTLCAAPGKPKRKLVRVVAQNKVDFSFLPVIGFYNTTINAEATGEAASLDVILLVDNSELMDHDTAPNYNQTDASVCNADNSCQPMAKVKTASKKLVDYVLNRDSTQEEDRLAIIYFSDGWEVPDPDHGKYIGTSLLTKNTVQYTPGTPSGWFTDHDSAVGAIDGLQVYDPGTACSSASLGTIDSVGLCRRYDTVGDPSTYQGVACPLYYISGVNDKSTCQTTNIGGALRMAGGQFANNANMDSVWVVILLTDGAANASCPYDNTTLQMSCGYNVTKDDVPINYCPDGTNNYAQGGEFCRNRNVFSASPYTDLPHNLVRDRNPADLATYNSNDFAMDAADFVACTESSVYCTKKHIKGQGAVIFAVGEGAGVFTNGTAGENPSRRPYGDTLLRYIASIGDDGDLYGPPDPDYNSTNPDPCSSVPVPASPTSYSCGNYYYSENGSDLGSIFDDIASKVFTRISK